MDILHVTMLQPPVLKPSRKQLEENIDPSSRQKIESLEDAQYALKQEIQFAITQYNIAHQIEEILMKRESRDIGDDALPLTQNELATISILTITDPTLAQIRRIKNFLRSRVLELCIIASYTNDDRETACLEEFGHVVSAEDRLFLADTRKEGLLRKSCELAVERAVA